ncbi:BAH domain-containing protein [Mycena chlorophos]|uniref:BAH domain-containing protein n=1 Tax=Mycena chlorophos TaxID=658473 RepID=A0A8H6SV56_MYCCL|nr:BAH domain-containing protein [Mycena chlorophos]
MSTIAPRRNPRRASATPTPSAPASSASVSKPASQARKSKPSSAASRKPRPKKQEVDGGDPDAPKEEEWTRMSVFRRFVVRDDEGKEHSFRVGDTAAILPATAAPGVKIPNHEYWVVKIKDIRGRMRSTLDDVPKPKRRKRPLEDVENGAADSYLDVWVRIQWYYSPQDVAPLVKGFDPAHCSVYERIYSSHSETISAQTFEGRVSVRKFHETSSASPPISSDEFFCRYYIDPSAQISLYIPKAAPSPYLSRRPASQVATIPLGCICDFPYDLQDPDPSRLMHMCLRCSRYHHRGCLLSNGCWRRKDTQLAPLAEEPFGVNEPPETHSMAPPMIMRLASLPIVRGAAITRAVPQIGIEGTGYLVAQARKVVDEWPITGDAWEKVGALGLVDAAVEELCVVADPMIAEKASGKEVVLVCPGCRDVM